jgi:hypothetical protein
MTCFSYLRAYSLLAYEKRYSIPNLLNGVTVKRSIQVVVRAQIRGIPWVYEIPSVSRHLGITSEKLIMTGS